ncbi:uncharacterized protein LOC110811885 [Carica papaya]|uniref:uncharacterized protein LOC110811885 n=1 Tax=Carica papaya TaxID=3649 RepID=UPI000B8C93AF|nr:uncharacterized protein LOC110811885 [Carica papaya]
MEGFLLLKPFLLFLLLHVVLGKECTNLFPQSHTVQHELSTSKNQTWKAEVLSHYHLTQNYDSVWSDLRPRKMLKEENEVSWAMEYRKIKNPSGFTAPGNLLQEISLHDVRLDPMSVQGQAQQTNLEYLLMLDPDNLVWSFRKTAGLPTPGTPYGGWEAPNIELRGHFVGHYLSATAQMWASTHNDTLNKKMSAVLAALSTCQEKMGSGYLSAFPSELFDRVEALQYVWAPYYTIHKIFAGLLDQNTLAGNGLALKMATWMAQYFYNRVQNVITKYTIERHWQSLNDETGGMNDVLYRLFSLTGDPKHLLLAHLFDKPCFLGLLAIQADSLGGFHANTHIPIVIGSQMRYEITGDPLYREMSTFFMETVNSSHSYATGGTSYKESWTDPKRLASTLEAENEESCATYNMLKISRNLFRWTKAAVYADFYERALTNGVLGIQRGTEPGIMIYMLPLGPGSSKGKSHHGWGTKFDSFWCCYGTGIESFSKLGDSLYFEEKGHKPSLYIIQYVSSSVNWKSGHISLNQKVDPVVSWDPCMRVTFNFSLKKGAGKSSTLNLRVPIWTHSTGAEVKLNSRTLPLPAPGSFLPVTHSWSPNDKLTLQLPLSLRTEAIKDDRPEYASLQAIFYGPYLLAGYSHGNLDIKTGSVSSLSDWITAVPNYYNDYLVTFSQQSGNSTFVLANSDQLIKMENYPEPGTDAAVHATFRIILSGKPSNFSSLSDFIGQQVILEPFDFPGTVLLQESDGGISVGNSSANGDPSSFLIVTGLDGKDGTVSLESQSQKGCFVYGGVDDVAGVGLSLKCKDKEGGFNNQAASFVMKKGLAEYHPISFIAKGANRSFVFSPLMSFRDESYTVYFSINQ